jgi:DNA polymerase-3 subunit beta
MKALCNREGLLAAFGMVGGVVPSRSPKPILQNIKLVADPDEGSIVMATDLEVGVRYRVLGVKVDQPGSAVLPTSRMGSILRTSTDEELAIETEGDSLSCAGCTRSSRCRATTRASSPRSPTSRRPATTRWRRPT